MIFQGLNCQSLCEAVGATQYWRGKYWTRPVRHENQPTLSGSRCELDVDECASSPCRHQGTCVDGAGSFRCQCRPGFSGAVCDVVDDPCRSSPCFNRGVCVWPLPQQSDHRPDAWTCHCRPGFTGDLCQVRTFLCEQGFPVGYWWTLSLTLKIHSAKDFTISNFSSGKMSG